MTNPNIHVCNTQKRCTNDFSTIDEFESMIVVNLTVEVGSGSTLVVDGELISSTLDNFGNMVDGILISMILVDQ